MASAAELKEKYRQRRESQQQQSAPTEASPAPTQIVDRGIKGTLIDDFLAIYGIPILIFLLIGGLYLGLERIVGAKILTPVRIWGLALTLYGFMCWKKFSFNYGLGGWIAVLSVSISTSGYLWEAVQAWVGKR